MNAMTNGHAAYWPPGVSHADTIPKSNFDRAALVAGAADRRARLLDLEAAMEQACEAAGHRGVPPPGLGQRTAWDRQAWGRYLDEAVRQAAMHARELSALRRDADHLDHLIACVS